MITANSPEGRIASQLRELGCPESNFAAICGVCGKTRLAQGLSGERSFEPADAEKMLTTLAEMKILQARSQSELDWKQVGTIKQALQELREAKIVLRQETSVLDKYEFLKETA